MVVSAQRYHPFNYWFVIVATTTVGTTISDYLDRTAGLGYPLASLLLFSTVMLILGIWRLTTGKHFLGRRTSPTERRKFFTEYSSWRRTRWGLHSGITSPIREALASKAARWCLAD